MTTQPHTAARILFAHQAGWTEKQMEYALHLCKRSMTDPFTRGDYDTNFRGAYEVHLSMLIGMYDRVMADTPLSLSGNGNRIKEIFLEDDQLYRRVHFADIREKHKENAHSAEWLWDHGYIVVGHLHNHYWEPIK